MFKKLLLALVLFAPLNAQAQTEIGDLKIKSFEEFFNPENTTLWDEIGAFGYTKSTYWRFNFPSMINVQEDFTVINLVMKSDVDYYSANTLITNQLNRQIGQSKVQEFPTGYRLTPQGWEIKENGVTYLIGFSRNPDDRTLYLFRKEG